MATPAPTEPLSRETDAFVYVVLGVLAELRRLEAVTPKTPVGARPPRGDDPAMLAALGLVSLRRTFERWIEIAAHDVPTDAGPRTPTAVPREIAR